ncbi:MAG: MFS transporter [Verrucomicrobiota bacterium]|jgi:Na+/melibiose symporter-like transporter
MSQPSQKLSFVEKAGYSCADAAANFVFMTMVCFQANFYTDVFGITAVAAGGIILVARLWDAFFDPLMGVLADRTNTRWGKFRPWILFSAVPWCVVMYLAYTTPSGWGSTAKVVYALATNILLMTIYSANNMPYAALGGVMTGNIDERAKLNSYRFIAVNAAQFIVVGITLPLVYKFGGPEHNRQHGWSMTMGLYAVLCLFLFLITFATSRERIHPPPLQKTPPKRDFADLLGNGPWKVMFAVTFLHFTMLAFQGSAQYNYIHSYANKAALFDWLNSLGLTGPPLADGAPQPGGILEFLRFIVHGDRASLENSNVADVGYSIISMIGKVVTILVILASPSLSRALGKKAVAVGGFALSAIAYLVFYAIQPANVGGIVLMTILTSAVYAPTIPLLWAMFADVADYSEWKNGRRATGMIFATICFALKAGLSLGSASFLWLMAMYGYSANAPQTPRTLEGMHMCYTVFICVLFAICTALLALYQISKRLNLQIANELAERRLKAGAPPA